MKSFAKVKKKLTKILSHTSSREGEGSSKEHSPGFTHGETGVEEVGHRRYVGGLWDEVGQLQFDFLLHQGLKPHHFFIDVACGSLRAGVYLIPYLEPEHYLGIDKEEKLIQAGIEEELSPELYEAKRPQFVVSDSFAFDQFKQRPDFGIAQSLFTHLPAPIIHRCFRKLRSFINDDGIFFATFFESQHVVNNRQDPHDHQAFKYTREQIEAFGYENGWKVTYIGNWNHPRGQVMVKYEPQGV